MDRIIVPQTLKKGDRLGIIAPAGQLTDPKRFESGIRILSEMGFEPVYPRSLWPGYGYLADSDSNRAEELHKIAADPEIKGLMAARGGYGCIRILELLDLNLLKRERKALVGFSDISLLLNQAVERAGLLCFHGPVVTSLVDCTNAALDRVYHCLTGNWKRSIQPAKLEILQGEGMISGKLIGGNLSTLMTMLGTPFDISWKNCILLLEDIGEPLYKVDRMLTQLYLSGKLNDVSGILLGDFTFGPEQDFLEKTRYTEYIWYRVLELTQSGRPAVWANIPSGHCAENLTLPFGASATLDHHRGCIHFQQ